MYPPTTHIHFNQRALAYGSLTPGSVVRLEFEKDAFIRGAQYSSGHRLCGHGAPLIRLPKPQPLPYDAMSARQRPWPERLRLACQAWALQGYGPPGVIYALYIAKIALYIALWWFFCFSSDWGQSDGWVERISPRQLFGCCGAFFEVWDLDVEVVP